ncbi:ACT domain-containing protein [Lentzea nigeriaca]|uniref:ACT domain-containing protein n=1 Tax=Lentzea nigeriaca TaxID=1128665 RepID=UPI00195C6EDE|nr:acetolactate synthase small subunit [Lentzea nigeriaca]MBM7862211.1 acetolactate synthase-1/3 small subunit [Lentzea nigeriaca]
MHRLSVLLRNKPGALARVVVLFSTRDVAVESLSLSPAGADGLSRLDVQVRLREGRSVDQLVHQLRRVVDLCEVSAA